MKVKLLRKTLKECKRMFSLTREYDHWKEKWRYSILKDLHFFNPCGQIYYRHIKFSYKMNCTEEEAIEALKLTIKYYAYQILHERWEQMDKFNKESKFNKRWKEATA